MTIAINFVAGRAGAERSTATFACKPGQSLMQAAVANDVDGIAADCGGSLTCATCHVYVDPAWIGKLPPADDEERAMLEFTAAERREGSRLSCQVRLTPELDGLVVELPPTQY